jgi:RNA-directed DNA polymerase
MRKPPVNLQDLRRRIYVKAKAEPSWRFWGLYVHICKRETLYEAYKLAKKNDGAPGIDGVTFEAIEKGGVEGFLEQIRNELATRQYLPMRNRKKEIPKGNGKFRTLGIPSIRDRVVQGAVKLILEPIFEADFQSGSYGYRPHRTAHQAVNRVAKGISQSKTHIIDLDLHAFFDNVKHDILMGKVAARIQDEEVLRLLKLILKATGKKGVPQGGVISPMLSNVYLNEVDRMLEKAREVTRSGKRTCVEYARYADDLVILLNGELRSDWLPRAVAQRLRGELAKVEVTVNEEKSRTVDLTKGESFGFLGFDFRRMRSHRGVWRSHSTPKRKKRTALLEKLRNVFRKHRSQPVSRVVQEINPILRGWVNYFRIGNSSRCFSYVRRWVDQKVRRHVLRAQKRPGFDWRGWSSSRLERELGVFTDYRIRYFQEAAKAQSG